MNASVNKKEMPLVLDERNSFAFVPEVNILNKMISSTPNYLHVHIYIHK